MKRLIIYDLDGTLVDTREDIARSANHMRGEMGLAPLPRGQICRFVGLGLRQLVENCLETDDTVRIEEGMTIYRAFYSEHLLDHTTLYPSVRAVLDYFQSRAQAVVTNKPDPYSTLILTALGVAGYFTEIIAGNSGYPKKPDPASVLTLLEKGKIHPEETLLIGDSPVDIETGTRAGVHTVGVAQGFAPRADLELAGPPDLVEDFNQLLELAKERRW